MASQSPVEPDRVQRRDRVHRALADARRRSVLRSLQSCGELPLRDLAERVERSDGPRTDADDRTERTERVRVDLYHRQVPVLADAGLVSYDPSERVVAITSDGADVDPFPTAFETTTR